MKISTVLVCLFGLSVGYDDKSIVQELAADGRFSVLAKAINAAGLDQALSAAGPFTIFAPTDTAFNKLGSATIDNLLKDPSKLADILKYHVLNGFVVSAMIKGDTRKDTLQGGQLDIAPSNGGFVLNGNANVDSTNKDLIVNNGVIQPIDTVLMPSSAPTAAQNLPISQFIKQDGRFTFLDMLMNVSKYYATLGATDRDFTFFAPTDAAFDLYKAYLGRTPTNETLPLIIHIAEELLKFHTVPGIHTASQLTNGLTLNTLHGTTTLKVNVVSSGVTINSNAHVIDPDLTCTNGVVHAIDALLLPPDIFQLVSGLLAASGQIG